MTIPADDFETAKAVFDKLKDLSQERQERVLRWVAEGLGVGPKFTIAGPSAAAATELGPGTAPELGRPASSGGHANIKTFIASKNPRSDQQFATTVAYYYRFEAPPAHRKESINTETLQEAARLAGRKRLTNPKSTLNNATGQGYLDRASRGEFAINAVGENLVAMTLPANGERPAKARSTRKPRVAKKPARQKR
jgi:hypothetical protein